MLIFSEIETKIEKKRQTTPFYGGSSHKRLLFSFK